MSTGPSWRHGELLAVVGGTPMSLYRMLTDLAKEGAIERVRQGVYRLPSTSG